MSHSQSRRGNRVQRSALPMVIVSALLAVGLTAPASAIAPDAPSNLSSSRSNNTTVTLSWGRVAGASGYDVTVGTETVRTVNNLYVPTKTIPSSVTSWQVRAVGSTNESSSFATGSLVPANVAGPSLLSPSAGATLQQPNDPPLLAWQPVSGAVAYTVSIDADDDFVGATEIRTRSTSLVVPSALTAGDWYWKVAADLGNGISSASSEERRFDVLPLADPVMISPKDNVEMQDVVLDWNPVVGAKSYEIQVARNNDFTNLVESKSSIYGTNYSPLTTYDNAQYFWRVRSVDVNDQSTPWSLARSVFTRTYPDAPTQIHPADSSIVGAPLYLQWDPVPHASEYELQMGTNENFSPNTFELCRIAGTTYVPFQFAINTSSQFTNVRNEEECRPAVNQTTYWRVRALDRPFSKAGANPGVQSQPSPTRSFTYRPNGITGMQPSNGATVTVPTLSWNPLQGTDTYTVTIQGSTSLSVTTSSTSFTPSQKLAAGTYTWTIRARTTDGQQSLLYSNTFNVSGAAPSAPGTALTPLTGRTTDSPTLSAPDLRWVPHPDASYYKVWVGAGGQYTAEGDPVFFEPTFQDFFNNQLKYPAMTEPSTRFLKAGQYHWLVQAFDATNNVISTGPLETFTISSVAPATGQTLALSGTVLAAGGGCAAALNSDGITGPRCLDVPTTPVLRWDPIAGANLYMVYVSKDQGFTNLLEPESAIPATSNTFYAPTLNNDAHTYPDVQGDRPLYWFIRPCRSVTQCGPTPKSGLARNAFTKVSPAVKTLSLETNVSGETTKGELNFRWEDYYVTNRATTWSSWLEKSTQSAMQYRIQVDTDTAFQAPFVDERVVDQAAYTAFDRLYREGELFWRVQAIDSDNNGLTWSAPQRIDKKTTPLEIVSPAIDSHIEGTVPLRWNAQAIVGSYDVEVYKGDDPNFSAGNRVFAANRIKTSAYVADVPLPSSGTAYRWRVRKRDASDNDGPWTTGRFFVRSSVPTLLSPAPGAAQPANAPVLAWQPVGEATLYQVTAMSTSGRNIASVETAATSHAVTGATPTGSYNWQVTALDSDRKPIGSASSTFTVDAGIKVVRDVEIQAPAGTGVGATLTSAAPIFEPADATLTYQWMRNGTNIFNATDATYTLTAQDFAIGISLKVTAKRVGFDEVTTVSNVIGATAGGALQATSQPSITGTPAYGSTLTVAAGTWSQPKPDFKYQWLRTGAPIAGATSSSYALTPEDAGKDLSVTVLAFKAGFGDGAATAPSVFIAKVQSTTTSTLSTTSVKRGKTVKVGVTVSIPGVSSPSGALKIQDGVKTLKTFTMDPFRKGVMTTKLSTKKLKVGRHKIKVVFVGNASINTSKSKVIRLIVKR